MRNSSRSAGQVQTPKTRKRSGPRPVKALRVRADILRRMKAGESYPGDVSIAGHNDCGRATVKNVFEQLSIATKRWVKAGIRIGRPPGRERYAAREYLLGRYRQCKAFRGRLGEAHEGGFSEWAVRWAMNHLPAAAKRWAHSKPPGLEPKAMLAAKRYVEKLYTEGSPYPGDCALARVGNWSKGTVGNAKRLLPDRIRQWAANAQKRARERLVQIFKGGGRYPGDATIAATANCSVGHVVAAKWTLSIEAGKWARRNGQSDLAAGAAERGRGNRARRRKPPAAITIRAFTSRQNEALKVVGECNGNFAEAGKRMGMSRQAVKQHHDAARRKLEAINVGVVDGKLKIDIGLPKDRRGQPDIYEDEDGAARPGHTLRTGKGRDKA